VCRCERVEEIDDQLFSCQVQVGTKADLSVCLSFNLVSLTDDASFDMDFPTTLQLKAEKVGKALTITSDALMAKKPTWRAEKM
jgi:hypothetical protein